MTESNPYATPSSRVSDLPAPALDAPEDITQPIKHGWVAALVSATLTLLVTVAALASSTEDRAVQALSFVDVALILGLAFGIYRKSRIASTLMFAYFLLSKIIVMVQTGLPSGVVLGLVFVIFYFRAMVATYRYHRFVKHVRLYPPPPRQLISDDPFFQSKPPSGT